MSQSLIFKNNNMTRGSRDLYAKVHETVAHVYSNHLCLTSFFSELQYSAAFGRESRKFAGGV